MSIWGDKKEWRVGHDIWNIYTYKELPPERDEDFFRVSSDPERNYINNDMFALCVMSDELRELLTHIKDRDEFPVSQLARDFLSQWSKLTEEVKETKLEAWENYEKYKDEAEEKEKEILEDLAPMESFETLAAAFNELGDDDEEESEEGKS